MYVDDENRPVVYVPIELLFTERVESVIRKATQVTEEWIAVTKLYENTPLIKLKPHRDLFRFFIDGSIIPNEYQKWYKDIFFTRNFTPDLDENELLQKRYNEFVFMQNELALNGLKFFIETPAKAEWNTKGYFNLADGHHRAVFLIEMGLRFVPCVLNRDDYFAWRNDLIAVEVQNIILETNRNEFYTPIYNPFYLNEKNICRDNFCQSRLVRIMTAMQNQRLHGKRVLDIGSNLGFISLHFFREGANVVGLEPDEAHYQLAIALQNLCYGECEIKQTTFEDYQTDKPFDIAIMLTVFYHYFNNPILMDENIRDRFIDKINENITSLIIWESGDDYEREKEYIRTNTKFKYYQHLSYTYRTGKLREMGMFMVDPHYLN